MKGLELKRKLPPRASDIEETKQLFADFGIKEPEIPDFVTYAELERWRKNYILQNVRR